MAWGGMVVMVAMAWGGTAAMVAMARGGTAVMVAMAQGGTVVMVAMARCGTEVMVAMARGGMAMTVTTAQRWRWPSRAGCPADQLLSSPTPVTAAWHRAENARAPAQTAAVPWWGGGRRGAGAAGSR